MIEYVKISTSNGQVHTVEPMNAETKTALEAGRKQGGTIVDTINKMAESDFRLLEGTAPVTECSFEGANVTVFMYREK